MPKFAIKYSLIFMSALLITGCEEKGSMVFPNPESIIVVDAIITGEFISQEVYVYQSSGEFNQASVPILNAHVYITDGTNSAEFVPIGTGGLYVSEPFAASIDKDYGLIVEYNGHIDTALAKMEPITPFKNDTVYQKGELYKFVYGGSDLPAMTEVYYDWSSVPEYCQYYGSCYAQTTHYTLNNIDIPEEFGPDKQEIWFPKGTILTRKKYSLSNEHQDFIRSLLIETQWRGGLFDIEQGNVPSNFKNGVRGWFGVCMVITDTMVVK